MSNIASRLIILLMLIFAISACSDNPMPENTATLPSTETPAPTFVPTFTSTPPSVIGIRNCNDIQETSHIGDGALNMIAYSPDGHWLAAATSTGVVVYDSVTLSVSWVAKTEANLMQIAFSTNGTTLTGVDIYSQIYRWQTDDGQNILSKVPDDVNELPLIFALSPDGNTLVVPYYDDTIRLYNTSDATLIGKIENSTSLGETIYKIAYSPDNNSMATISLNGNLRLWSISELKIIAQIEYDQGQRPSDIDFSPDRATIAVNMDTQSGDTVIRVFDFHSLSWLQTLDGKLIAFISDGSFISRDENNIVLRNYKDGNVLKRLPDQGVVGDVFANSPDGEFLAFGTNEGIQIQHWDNPANVNAIQGQYSNYSALAISPDDFAMAGGILGGIELRSIADKTLIHTFSVGNNTAIISSIAYSPSGDMIAATSKDSLYVWMVETEKLLWSTNTGHTVNKLAFSPDSSMIAAAYSDTSFKLSNDSSFYIPLWNAMDGGQLVELKGPQKGLFAGYSSLAFSSDGDHLFAAEENGDIDIWLLTYNSLSYSLTANNLLSWNSVIAVSPDGQQYTSGGMNRQILVWPINSYSPFKVVDVGSAVTALGYSPDGKLVAAGVGNDILILNAEAGSILCTVKGSKDTLHDIIFTNNGYSIVSLAKDGVIRFWGIP